MDSPRRQYNQVTIRSAVLSSYRLVSDSLNIKYRNLLRAVQLDPLCLEDPDIPLPVIKVIKLIEMSAIASGCSDLGIRLALARGTPDIGPLSLLLREEPNLGSALRSLQRYFPIHSRGMKISLEDVENTPILTSNFAVIAEPFAANQSTEMVISGLLMSIRWLAGYQWRPAMVCFSHMGPVDKRHHETLLGCPVEFGHSFDGLVLSKGDLQLPVAQADPKLRLHAESYVRSLAGSTQGSFDETVSALINSLLPLGRCSSATIAHLLGVDRSTLVRRLQALGLTFSDLLQEQRMRIAARSCLSGSPLYVIADELGFSGPSTCARWFAESFGSSAKVWRRQQLSGAQEKNSHEEVP